VWHLVSDLITDVADKTMDGINMVEYNGNSIEELAIQVQQLTAQLDQDIAAQKGGVIGYQVTSDLSSINKLYTMRKKAVGLLGNTKGTKKPIAFAEDTAVPPENLADFIAEFRSLLDSYQLDYGMFGHVDAGVLHVRPALDMCDPEQEKLLRQISDKVVQLTAKYGGLMWGEHGKGYRSEYGPEFFGETLFTELRKIKTIFDPLNKMNPGKICTPLNSEQKGEYLVSVDDTKRGFYDRQIPISIRDEFSAALNCNGNGLCFNYDLDSPMCPSSKVTRDRKHSPKGRAGLMREWLRLLENKGINILELEENVNRWSVKRLLNKVKNQFVTDNSDDFSHEVMQAMAGCLACKACASQCPIKVDVPDFRARFINLYHSRYARPLKDHLVAHVETLAPIMAHFPRVVNKVLASKSYKSFSKKAIGYVDTPLLTTPTLQQQITAQHYEKFNLSTLAQLSAKERQNYILIVQDPFTSFYDANTVSAFMALVKKLGYKPVLLPFKPNGKAQHVKGFLAKFAKTAQSSADFLNTLHQLDIPMIGLDASLVLCYRDEYTKTLKEKRGNFKVLLSHEWLINLLPKMSNEKLDALKVAKPYDEFYLFTHCTEKTALANSESEWQAIFQFFGLSLNKVAVGCCGMAGTYGHEASNYNNSKQLFEMSWQDKLVKLKPEQLVVTGFSCRSQVKRFANLKARHPVEVILSTLS
jgi:Fe-S oxidoreductase